MFMRKAGGRPLKAAGPPRRVNYARATGFTGVGFAEADAFAETFTLVRLLQQPPATAELASVARSIFFI
jgi:hypothetical protein